MNNDTLVFMVFFPLIFLFAFFIIRWQISAAHRMLQSWARQNGVELQDYSLCWLRRGPFWLRSSKSQMIYRVRIIDGNGAVFTGWAKCGHWMWGVFVDKVDVIWDQ